MLALVNRRWCLRAGEPSEDLDINPDLDAYEALRKTDAHHGTSIEEPQNP